MSTRLEQLADAKEKLAAVEALRDSPAFRTIMLPHFRERLEYHARQCRNRDLSPEKRSEHVEAAELADSLLTYLDNRATGLKGRIAQLRAGGG